MFRFANNIVQILQVIDNVGWIMVSKSISYLFECLGVHVCVAISATSNQYLHAIVAKLFCLWKEDIFIRKT